jgi:putative component of toxin-antitoxin plasmid stabilization module
MLSRMTATQAKWSERVQAWRASGKTADEYASAFEFQASTLRYWASRLKTESAEKPAVMARVVRRRSPPGDVEPAGAGVEGVQPEVEIAVGGARILVRRGFDAELLRQVAAALGNAR